MSAGDPVQFQRILGIRFYNGDARGAVDLISENGGVLVAPAAPALKNIPHNPGYREALDDADLAIADSAFMVLIWNLTGGPRMAKLSGLKYLRCLVEQPHFRAEGSSFWVMPSARAATLSRRWLDGSGIAVDEDNLYVAPLYSDVVADPTLLQVLDKRQPRHIVRQSIVSVRPSASLPAIRCQYRSGPTRWVWAGCGVAVPTRGRILRGIGTRGILRP
jgi:hypothetical protein